MRHTFTFTRQFNTRVDPTENVKSCAAMFGIGINEDIEITLYKDLSVTLGDRRIVFITGDSGAGKSTLLREIAARADAHDDFQLVREADMKALPDVPLLDQFGDWGIKQIGELLTFVGISEPFVYLRKPRELSDGQRYRFSLALMIYAAKIGHTNQVPVICIDEFLAFLDRETARNVAYQVRRAATMHQLCFVVATTHQDIEADLQANTRICLRLNLPPEMQNRPLAGI